MIYYRCHAQSARDKYITYKFMPFLFHSQNRWPT